MTISGAVRVKLEQNWVTLRNAGCGCTKITFFSHFCTEGWEIEPTMMWLSATLISFRMTSSISANEFSMLQQPRIPSSNWISINWELQKWRRSSMITSWFRANHASSKCVTFSRCRAATSAMRNYTGFGWNFNQHTLWSLANSILWRCPVGVFGVCCSRSSLFLATRQEISLPFRSLSAKGFLLVFIDFRNILAFLRKLCGSIKSRYELWRVMKS